MAGKEDCLPLSLLFQNQLDQRIPHQRVKPGRGFVQQVNIRLRHKCGDNAHFLLHALAHPFQRRCNINFEAVDQVVHIGKILHAQHIGLYFQERCTGSHIREINLPRNVSDHLFDFRRVLPCI